MLVHTTGKGNASRNRVFIRRVNSSVEQQQESSSFSIPALRYVGMNLITSGDIQIPTEAKTQKVPE